jgi:hypothetical protein
MRHFVLSSIAKGDREMLGQAEELAAKAVETLISSGIEKAMAEFNGIDLRKGPEEAQGPKDAPPGPKDNPPGPKETKDN